MSDTTTEEHGPGFDAPAFAERLYADFPEAPHQHGDEHRRLGEFPRSGRPVVLPG